jgi:hypothetical protein
VFLAKLTSHRGKMFNAYPPFTLQDQCSLKQKKAQLRDNMDVEKVKKAATLLDSLAIRYVKKTGYFWS